MPPHRPRPPHRSRPRTLLACALLGTLAPACISHSHATDMHGVDGIRGVPIEYQTTSSWALHGLFTFPLIGNAKSERVVGAFAEEAAARGSRRLRITQTSSTTFWFILPPLSFFLHPVHTTVEGDIEVEALPED